VAATIDTLKLAETLSGGPVPEAQGEVFAGSLREVRETELGELATRQDVALVRAAVESSGNSLKAERREEVLKLERRIDGLENRIEGLGQRLTIRLGLMIGAGVAILAANSWLP
jgi:hypothetical protein